MTNASDARMKAALADWTDKNNLKSKESLAAPPANTDIKVEWYELNLWQQLVIGTPILDLSKLRETPQTRFRPEHVQTNCPSLGFAFLRDFYILKSEENEKISLLCRPIGEVNSWDMDLWACSYSNDRSVFGFDSPVMQPNDTIVVSAYYTGLVPEGFTEGKEQCFTVVFYGRNTVLSD